MTNSAQNPASKRPGLRALTLLIAGFLVHLAWIGAASATTIERVTSQSGVEAWLVEDHSLPLITVKIAFRGGSSQDPEAKEGLANLVSGLIDEGAGELDSQGFQGRMRELAISLSFQTGRDVFEGSLRTLSENSDEAFRLLRLALNEPRFDDEPVERIRAQILNGIRANQQDPSYIARRAWLTSALPDHTYTRERTGTEESVNGIATDDMRRYVSRVFARENLMIAVVGDINAARLSEVLDQVFGGLPESPDLVAIPDTEPVVGPIRQIIEMDIPQAIVRFGSGGPARSNPDFIPAFIVNHILGGGSFSSRLYNEVREKRGLAYSVYSFLLPLEHVAFFAVAVATQNERVAETIETIEAEIRRMAEEGPTEAELASAKSYLIGSYALRFDTGAKIADQLIGIQKANLGIDYINDRNGMIEAVTIEDVRRAARNLLNVDSLITTIVGMPVGVTEVNAGG